MKEKSTVSTIYLFKMCISLDNKEGHTGGVLFQLTKACDMLNRDVLLKEFETISIK